MHWIEFTLAKMVKKTRETQEFNVICYKVTMAGDVRG